MHKYLAEAFGTFVLTTAVLFSLAGNSGVPTPVIAGLTLGLLVYSLGPISGTHINPAVTIGLWSIKKIESMQAAKYIIAQGLGAYVALLVGRLLITTAPVVSDVNTLAVGIAELLGTLVFTFGIAAVVHEKVPKEMAGVVIGGSLLLGVVIASYLSNGILNPAVALGLGSFYSMYILGPVIGSVLGMHLFKYLASKS